MVGSLESEALDDAAGAHPSRKAPVGVGGEAAGLWAPRLLAATMVSWVGTLSPCTTQESAPTPWLVPQVAIWRARADATAYRVAAATSTGATGDRAALSMR